MYYHYNFHSFKSKLCSRNIEFNGDCHLCIPSHDNQSWIDQPALNNTNGTKSFTYVHSIDLNSNNISQINILHTGKKKSFHFDFRHRF